MLNFLHNATNVVNSLQGFEKKIYYLHRFIRNHSYILIQLYVFEFNTKTAFQYCLKNKTKYFKKHVFFSY